MCVRQRKIRRRLCNSHTHTQKRREMPGKVFFVGSSQKAISPFMANVCCCCRLGRRCPATQLSHKTTQRTPNNQQEHPPPIATLKSCCHHNLQQQNLSEGVIRLGTSLSHHLTISLARSEPKVLLLLCVCVSVCVCEWGKVFFPFYLLVSCAAASYFLPTFPVRRPLSCPAQVGWWPL